MDHIVVIFFIFFKESLLFSIVAASIYIHISSAQGFPFPHNPTNTCCYFFDNSHSDRYEVGFDLHFCDD